MKIPTDRGPEAAEWLASKGLRTRKVYGRASDYDLYSQDPFNYYLRVRLGLRSIIETSPALGYGNWMHKAHECTAYGLVPPPSKPNDIFLSRLGQRQNELCELGLSDSHLSAVLDREEKMAHEAWVWHHAALTTPLPNKGTTTAWSILAKQICLGTEVKLEHDGFMCEIDDLRYNPDAHEVNIWDLKSTGGSASHRMAACSFEFATWLYRAIVEADLALGPASKVRELVKKTGHDPTDVKFGAFVHLVVAKPTIKFGLNDRSFTVRSHVLKSGPRKGQTEMRKEYTGEPSLDIYIQRCYDWYKGMGDFLDQAEERRLDPPVNLSETRFTGVPLWTPEHATKLQTLKQVATLDPCYPWNFPRSSRAFIEASEKSPYLPFYTAPIREWPDLVKSQGLIQSWRSPLNG